MLKDQVLATWNTLKAKITEKFNQSKQVVLYRPWAGSRDLTLANRDWRQLEELRFWWKKLADQKDSKQFWDRRSKRTLLAPEEQARYNKLGEEIKLTRQQISQREWLTNQPMFILYENLKETEQAKEEYLEQLKLTNEKHDRLNDRLNWLRTLVRTGDLKQLQELVRAGRV